ncbi:MAG: 23S rRNA (adenine(2503)-C(2))-methyltransferase RlmN, partial [Deltaproteobacteria bacterium]
LNSDLSSAAKLGKILGGFDCKVNLIIYNPVEELGLKAPARPEIISFKERLEKSGIRATLRRSRGQDIAAACGQLRLSYVKK